MNWNISAIKEVNREKGFHYFERATMRFFDSRVASRVYQGEGGVFFVTSEQFHGSGGYSGTRKFTIRQFFPETGEVETFGPFNELPRERALRIARIAARYPEAAKEALAA